MVSNLDSAPAGPFTIRVEMLRPAMTSDESDRFVEAGTERYAGVLTSLASATGEVVFAAPDWILAGSNELRCTVDSDEEVAESDEANNADGSSLTATALPDLRMELLSSDLVGDSATYSFRVHNDGPIAVAGVGWQVTADCEMGVGTIAMDGGLYVGASASIFVSDSTDIAGCLGSRSSTQLAFYADRADNITESDETNNSAGAMVSR